MAIQSKPYQAWIRSHPLLWGYILVAIFSLMRVAETVTWHQWFGSSDFQESVSFALFLLLWFVIMSVGLIGWGIVRLTRTSWQALGWKREGLTKALGMGFVGFILLYINVVVWSMLKGNLDPPAMISPSLARLFLVAFFAFGLPAWVEENLYRGYLQPLLAEKMSLQIAIVVQAALFSVAHLGYLKHPLDFGSAFVAGLILGWLRGRDASLIAPYLAHGLFWTMGAFMAVTP